MENNLFEDMPEAPTPTPKLPKYFHDLQGLKIKIPRNL